MNNYLKLGNYFLRGVIFGFKFPVAVSFDVTNKCNLKCKHCYFFPQDHQQELSDDGLYDKIKEIRARYPSIIQASWGGNHYLEEILLKKG